MKVFAVLFSLLFVFNCFANDANTICRNAGAVVLVLHKDVNGSVSENADGKWAVTVDYDILSGGDVNPDGVDTITGTSSCNTVAVKSAPDGSSYNGGTAEPGDANTFAKLSYGNVGNKCWCRMTGPITSWWMYVKTYDDNDACKSDCNTYCANGFANNTEMSNGRLMRNAFIDSVW